MRSSDSRWSLRCFRRGRPQARPRRCRSVLLRDRLMIGPSETHQNPAARQPSPLGLLG